MKVADEAVFITLLRMGENAPRGDDGKGSEQSVHGEERGLSPRPGNVVYYKNINEKLTPE